MIKFLKSEDYNAENFTDYKGISRALSINELEEVVKGNHILINGIPRSINITNKGGQRLINAIRIIMAADSDDKDIVVVFNPAKIKYLYNTKPQNLYNFSATSRIGVIDQLMDTSVMEYRVDGMELVPKRFTTHKAMFDWILKTDPTNSIKLFDEIRKAKSDHEDLLEKDLQEFSELIPTASTIATELGFDKSDVIEAVTQFVV